MNFIKYKMNIGMHIFQHYDIITKKTGHFLLMRSFSFAEVFDNYTVNNKNLVSMCACIRVLECLCMCVRKRMRD